MLEAAHKTLALHALNGRWDGVSINIGSIHGGTRPNIVADEAVIGIDMRASDLASQQVAAAAIRHIIDSTSVPDVTSSTELSANHKPMEKMPNSARLIEQAVAVAADLGFVLGDAATGGGSDAKHDSGTGRAYCSMDWDRSRAVPTPPATTSSWSRSCLASRCWRRFWWPSAMTRGLARAAAIPSGGRSRHKCRRRYRERACPVRSPRRAVVP